MRRLAKIFAVIAGLSIAGSALAVETSSERYAEPYPHKPDQDTGTPRLGPKSDYVAQPGSAAAVEKETARMANMSKGDEEREPGSDSIERPPDSGKQSEPVRDF